MTAEPAPTLDQVRAFVSSRYGARAAETLRLAGAGEWSRAFSLRARVSLRAEVGAEEEPGGGPAARHHPAEASSRDDSGTASTGGPQDLVIRFGRHRADFVKDRIVGELVRDPGAAGLRATPGRDAPLGPAAAPGRDATPGPAGAPGRPVTATGPVSLPVPRVLQIGETPWGYFAVAQRCRGRYLDDLSGDEMHRVLPALLGTLDAVARLTPPGTGYGLWDERGEAPWPSWRRALLTVAEERPRTAGWRDRLAGRPGPADVFRRGLVVLDGMLEALESRGSGAVGPGRIVHGDLLNRNVLVDPASPDPVTAVLDWGNAMYGDPLYDVAWLLFWWPWYPAWSGVDAESAVEQHHRAAHDRTDRDARLLAYRLHIGLDSLTYNALTERWPILDRVAQQVDGLLSQVR